MIAQTDELVRGLRRPGLAEPLDGPTVTEWAELARAHELVLVGGVCERDGERLRNTAVIVDPSGMRAVYRKAHLGDREQLFFEPGCERPPAVGIGAQVEVGAERADDERHPFVDRRVRRC